MTVIGITHEQHELDRYYEAADLERLRQCAELRILGSPESSDFLAQLADVDVLTGSWGMPVLAQ